MSKMVWGAFGKAVSCTYTWCLFGGPHFKYTVPTLSIKMVFEEESFIIDLIYKWEYEFFGSYCNKINILIF